MKNRKKSKVEKLFGLTLVCIALFGIFCLSGCGGNSCEKIKCGSEEYNDISISACSIPGPGACLTFGHGCNFACWPQSCKISKVLEEEKENSASDNLLMCDSVYYGGGCFGCLGCEQSQKSCYTGCGEVKTRASASVSGENTYSGCFFGKIDADEKKEKWFGCRNGCAGCAVTEGELGEYVHMIEELGGIN